MDACPIRNATYLRSTDLSVGELGIFLQDSNVPGTDTILVHSLPEQIEWYRSRGGVGQSLSLNVDGKSRSFGRHREWPGVPIRVLMPETISEDEAIQGTGSR
jgi:hypothetical protein